MGCECVILASSMGVSVSYMHRGQCIVRLFHNQPHSECVIIMRLIIVRLV